VYAERRYADAAEVLDGVGCIPLRDAASGLGDDMPRADA
jgi:hypothetical protein